MRWQKQKIAFRSISLLRHVLVKRVFQAKSCILFEGWICYVEKTHGSWCLPYLAKTRSAQATMGTIIKRHLCPRWNLRPEDVYHCTIMSCYDKKLEAARPQFLSSDDRTPEVVFVPSSQF